MVQQALVRLQQLSAIGVTSRDERLKRATLLLLSLITCLAGAVWGLSYWGLGLYGAGIVPVAYSLIVLFSIVGFILTERFHVFAWIQLSLLLILPFVVQWLLGGFVPGGGVMLWGIVATIGAFVFLGPALGWAWFAAYMALTAGSLIYDYLYRFPTLPEGVAVTSGGLAFVFALVNFGAVSIVIFAIAAYVFSELQREQANVERLLRNVLPPLIADRVRSGETAIADSFEEVTILFADVVGFTRLAAAFPADNLVRLLNRIFSAFDKIAERWEVEKIKTIGDAYMVASGIPVARHDHTVVVAEVALAMRDAVARIAADQGMILQLRLGIHTGPVVAGIIGLRKFAYDVWGDTVNIASRMESTAPAGTIQVSAQAGRKLAELYTLQSQEPVAVRGRGEMETFHLIARRPDRPDELFPSPDGRESNIVEFVRQAGS